MQQLPVDEFACVRNRETRITILAILKRSLLVLMVALADWYGLPILLQLEKLFSPRDGLPDYWSISTAFAEYAELVVQPI